ncbi:hypothetical protein K3Z80_08965, partial [Pseudomonas aeruginosa]|nr:hypothetical protein [Pseudomonas aeruginosa]
MNRLQPVRLVSFVTTDLAGITRGRSLPLATLEEQLASGCGWVPANSSLTPQDLIEAGLVAPLLPEEQRAALLAGERE